MQYWICMKESIKYSNKYVLNDVLNGNECSIKYVWKKASNTGICSDLNDVLNDNQCNIKYH